MQLTAEQILDIKEDGDDPVMWSAAYASRVLDAHGASIANYVAEPGSIIRDSYDAADLLSWLGY